MEDVSGVTTSEKNIRPLFTGRDLWLLIWPLLVEQFLNVLVGAADTVMVSRVGEAAVSGVSLVDMINILGINLFTALATGGAVIVSQYIGAKKPERAEKSAGQLVLMAAVLGCAIGFIYFAFAAPVLTAVYGGVEPDVFEACLIYMRITALGYPFLALYNAGAAYFRALGNSRISMQVSIFMNIINVAGNAICIFVLNMGVAGVAWPTAVSRLAAAAVIMAKAFGKDNAIRLKAANITHFNKSLMARILNIGVPSALENSLFQAGKIVTVTVVAAFGTIQISANAVSNNISMLFCVPGMAVGMAMITVIGRTVGAQDHKETIRYTKLLMFIVYASMWVSGAIVFLLLPVIMGLYSLSEETLALATLLNKMHLLCGVLIWPLAFSLPNSLRAAGDARFTMAISVISMALCRVGLSYILGLYLGWGAVGVWVAMFIDWVFRAVFFVWRFISGGWKSKYTA